MHNVLQILQKMLFTLHQQSNAKHYVEYLTNALRISKQK